MNSSIILVENLTRRFGNVTAVNDLSFEVHKGEVFGFLGHNGAGKTTTVRLLNGVLEPHSGSMHVLGLDPIADGPALRAHTGVLTETAAVEGRLTARENLLIYADLFGVPKEMCTERVKELLEFFELSEHADKKAEKFSTGMRQRLALARTLLHDPDVLFLDEPTVGLDPVAANMVIELIANLSKEKGHTIFLCTHNLIEAQRLCDRVAIMEEGHLAAIGTPEELTHRYIQRLDIEIEVDLEDIQIAREILSALYPMVHDITHSLNENLMLTITSRDEIPEILNLLVLKHIRVYKVAAHHPTLEDVYFALHNSKEEIQ